MVREAVAQLERECAAEKVDDVDNRQPLAAVPINNPHTDTNAPGTSQAGALGTRVPMTTDAANGGGANNDHSSSHSHGNRGGTEGITLDLQGCST